MVEKDWLQASVVNHIIVTDPEEEDSHIDSKVCCVGAHRFSGTLSRRG